MRLNDFFFLKDKVNELKNSLSIAEERVALIIGEKEDLKNRLQNSILESKANEVFNL